MARVDLQDLAKETLRIGIVTSTDPEKCTAKVALPDVLTPHLGDNGKPAPLVSFDLKVAQRKTHDDKRYWMPDVGERVLCAFLGNGLSYGVVLCSFYWDEDVPPANCQDKDHTRYKDGTVMEYDRKEHRLTADIKGDAVLKVAGNVTIEAAGNIKVNGARIDLN